MARVVNENGPAEWTLANEFAQVRLRIDRSGNSARLHIEDLQSGHTICLDAMTLASLVWSPDEMIAAHSDPDLTYKALQNETFGIADVD